MRGFRELEDGDRTKVAAGKAVGFIERRRKVSAELKTRLNWIGKNLSNKRVAAVMDMIRQKYGYDTVTEADIFLEVDIFVNKLRQG